MELNIVEIFNNQQYRVNKLGIVFEGISSSKTTKSSCTYFYSYEYFQYVNVGNKSNIISHVIML